jgi:peptidoglycan/xylan/chitin deacetylase (PgdA/CDA1 family)
MSARTAVLTYHAIGTPPRPELAPLFVSPEAFAAQLAHLAARRRVVPLDRIVRGEVGPGPPAVAITFDDGYRSVLTGAAPLLARHRFPATVFVATAWIGRHNGWDAGAEALELMDADELRDAERRGLAIESHGHAHVDLADPHVAREDLAASREAIRAICGREARYLAYPWGSSSTATRHAAEEAGFEAAFSIDRPDEGPFARERIGVTWYDRRPVYAVKSSGRYLGLRSSPFLAPAVSVLGRLARR